MIISNAAIRNRVTVLILILLIAYVGGKSYLTLPREAAPDVKIPYILVSVTNRGVSPEDIENTITIEIENELSGISGLKEVRSSSAEGKCTISCEFEPNVEVEDALRRVKDKVDIAKAELPDEADEPTVTEINVAEFPVMMLNISGTISPVRLKAIADELEDQIEGVEGVLDVDVLGALEREIRIEIDQDRVAAYGFQLAELLTLIASENVNVSAGALDTEGTKFNVRVPAEFAKPEEIAYLRLANRNGKPIYLKDVATISDAFEDPLTYARLDGKSSITLAIKKRVGANIVAMAEWVKGIVAEARKRAPSGVEFDLTRDYSKDINKMLADLENNILTALVLVVIVLVLFMGLRSSVIVAFAIPMSMLMSFAIIDALGYTLNMIVLFSLILALGMLVDNAIVITENIYRHRELGAGAIEAARKGTAEVAWPVIASTATTVAAFAPVMFWPGVAGDFMKYLPITVIIVLSSSLFVAMVITPVLCSLGGGRLRAGPVRRDNWFILGYRRLLSVALRHRAATLVLAVLTLVGVLTIYGKRNAGRRFFPKLDPNQAVINIRSPQGTSIDQSDRLTREVERRVEDFRKGPDGAVQIKHVVANVGSTGGFVFVGRPAGAHVSNVTLTFPDFLDRQRHSTDVLADIRGAMADIPGAEIKVEEEREGPPTGAPVTVQIIGKEFDKLRQLSERAKMLIQDVPNMINLRSDLETTKPELVFRVSRDRAKRLGVSSELIGLFLKTAVFGMKVGSFRQFNDEYDITVRLPLSQRTRIDDLLRLRVPTSAGKAVPLSSLGYFEYAPGYGTIYRVDEKRVVTLTADVEGRLGPDVLADVQERLAPLGRNRLIAADVKDWPRFRSLLSEGRDEASAGLGRAILDRLGGRARRLLQEAGPLDAAEKAQLLAEVNDLLSRRDFPRPSGEVELPEEARRLMNRPAGDLSEDEVMRLNRLLVQAAYPSPLAESLKLDLPANYEIRYAGEKEHQEEAEEFLSKAFIIALLLIVGILVTQFNTFSAPLIIMTTVLLSTIGVFMGLLVFDMPFIIVMTGVGVISLAGVVVNNAIVLLDYTRKLQNRGLDPVEAAIRAGQTRLRPVLLTAVTTILGLVPMATGLSFNFRTFRFMARSESSQWWSGMAIVVIFGLASATLLTLVVVPSLYVTLYRVASRLGLGGLKRAGEPAKAALEMADF
jgi:multidrug efflux pump subunit AcrB